MTTNGTATMRFLAVKNMEKHQHYQTGDRTKAPPWIKLYYALLDDYAFLGLTETQQIHLVLIWLVASRHDNRIPYDERYIRAAIRAKRRVDLAALIAAGFLIEIDASTYASTPDSTGDSDSRARAKEEEAESEGDAESSSSPHPNGARPSGGDVPTLGPVHRLIAALNVGQSENPHIDQQRFRPVLPTHGASEQAAQDILAAGVPVDFAAERITAEARAYQPGQRNRQIHTLEYLRDRTIEAWEKRNAVSSTSKPQRRTKPPTESNGYGKHF